MPGRRRRRRPGGKRVASILLVVVGAVALGWLVLAVALAASFSPRLATAAILTPNHPNVVFKLAAAEYGASGGQLPPDTFRRVTEAAAVEPLAAEPFFYGAVHQGGQRADRTIRLLEEARRRNPRYRLARLMLVDRYLRANRIDEATEEVAVLARLMPDSRVLLVEQLARLAVSPDTRASTRRALANDPLLELVLEQLAHQGADPEIILELARTQPRSTATAPAWQALLVEALVRQGQIGRANRLWSQFSGVPDRNREAPYDADFRGLPGSPPFNWQLAENETGTAERSRNASLQIDYFGRQSGELASQLLMLAPGRYRIRFRAEGDANGQDSRMVWRVICHGAQAALLELPVVNVTSAPRPFRGEFLVPGGCPAQWLRLEGVSAEFPTTQSVEIRGLRIERMGGGA